MFCAQKVIFAARLLTLDIMSGVTRPSTHDAEPSVSAGATQTACRRTLVHEGRELTLALSCRDCAGKAQLAQGHCLRGALEALAAEQGADSLVLAGQLETQVRSGGMAVLERLVLLANDLDHLSQREPPPGSRECARCTFAPRALFGGLRGVLLTDPPEFPGALKTGLSGVVASVTSGRSGAGCARCLGDTASDLGFAADSFEELVRLMMKQGFQIVV